MTSKKGSLPAGALISSVPGLELFPAFSPNAADLNPASKEYMPIWFYNPARETRPNWSDAYETTAATVNASKVSLGYAGATSRLFKKDNPGKFSDSKPGFACCDFTGVVSVQRQDLFDFEFHLPSRSSERWLEGVGLGPPALSASARQPRKLSGLVGPLGLEPRTQRL